VSQWLLDKKENNLLIFLLDGNAMAKRDTEDYPHYILDRIISLKSMVENLLKSVE